MLALGIAFGGYATGIVAAQKQPETENLWTTGPMYAAYGFGVLAAVCFVMALRSVRFPFLREAVEEKRADSDRRHRILGEIRSQYRAEYMATHGDNIPHDVMMGTMDVPREYINARLQRRGEDWRV